MRCAASSRPRLRLSVPAVGSKLRLLCDENITGLEAIAPHCDLRRMAGRSMSREHLEDADALWVRSVTRVDAALLEGTPVRFVGTATAGIEHVDRDYLASRDIEFCSAPGANANAVVEYVLGALALLDEPWRQLDAGGVLGIIGFGHVGRLLHEVAVGLGWRTRVTDPWVDSRGAADIALQSLDAVMEADVISVHCELTDEQPWPSRHLLDESRLAALSESQWLLNAARGEVVDGAALLRRIRGAAPPQVVLDVWEGEPGFDAALLRENALRLATPHIAGYSWDAKWGATRMLAQALLGEGVPKLVAPEQEPPPLRVSAADLDSLPQALLLQRYALREDDQRMRSLLALPDCRARRAGFDALRREYPVRRELRGSTLDARSAVAGDPGLVMHLRALGVSVAAV